MTELYVIAGTVVITSTTYWYISRRLAALRRHTEEAARALSPAHPFRVIADFAPSLIWLSGPDSGRTFCNRYWLEFTGRTIGQEMGDGWAEGVHPEDRPDCRRALWEAHEERRPLVIEYRLRRADGAYRWILDQSVPRFDGEGTFAGYIGCCIDITDRREAERARAELAAIVANSDDAIIGETLDGTITSWNRGAERLFGFRADEALGRSVSILLPTERSGEMNSILSRLRAGERIDTFETVRVRKDGGRIDVWLSVSPIRDGRGRIVGASKIARDLRARKELEESLIRGLHRQHVLMRELNHRVRNNLAGLIGLVRLYERSGRGGREVAAAVTDKILAIKEVHDIISRVGWGPMDLGELIRAFSLLFAPQEAGPRVIASGPAVEIAPGQAGPLAMILQELFTNSRKHGALSSTSGAITIQWRTSPEIDANTFELLWRESGGPSPPSPAPDQTGVGLPLIQGFAAAELRGGCEFHFDPEGLRCVLRGTASATGSAGPPESGAGSPALAPATIGSGHG